MNFRVHSLLCAALLAAPAAAQTVDFAGLAERYLQQHPVPGVAEGDLRMDDVLDAHYLRASLGALDVCAPRADFDDKSAVGEFRDALVALLQVQRRWLDWVAAQGVAATLARSDIGDIERFLKSAKVAPGGAKAPSLFDAFSGARAVQPQLERLAASFRDGSALGLTARGGDTQTLILAPSRQSFVELAALFGRFDAAAKSLYWHDGLLGWTEFGWQNLQVVATRYPPLRVRTDDFSESVAMDSKEATGLLQHIAQRGAVMLCWACFGEALDPAFELALAQVMVVELYGQNNTRSGGSGRPNSTDGITAFIPGGNSSGGALPPTNADNRWRAASGADYFLKVLKESQKAGSKSGAKVKAERGFYFQLQAQEGGKQCYVRAPFFGSAAQGKERPPAEFLVDYLEFYRAYKTLFVHWLREASAAEPAAARAALAKLFVQVAEAGGAASFEELVLEVYAVPFSAADLGADNLERRFLEWLAKQ